MLLPKKFHACIQLTNKCYFRTSATSEKVPLPKKCNACMLLSKKCHACMLLPKKCHECMRLLLPNICDEKINKYYLACTIGFAGLGAAFICFLGDYLYYLNRNTLMWAYLESSAFPCGFLLINAILHHISKWLASSFSINLDSN